MAVPHRRRSRGGRGAHPRRALTRGGGLAGRTGARPATRRYRQPMTRRRRVGLSAVAIVAASASAIAIAIVSLRGGDVTEPVAVADARPAPGDYTGRSSQGLPITATVAADRATLTLDVRWRCVAPRDPAAGHVRPSRHATVTVARRRHVLGGDRHERAPRRGRASDGALRGPHDRREDPARRVERRPTNPSPTTPTSGAPAATSRSRSVGAGRRRAPTRAAGRSTALDGPREVAAAAGRVWVLEEGRLGPAVVGIDRATGAARVRTRIGGLQSKAVAPPGVAFPPVLAAVAGAAWVVTGIIGPRFELTRVDGRTGAVRRVAVAPPPPRARRRGGGLSVPRGRRGRPVDARRRPRPAPRRAQRPHRALDPSDAARAGASADHCGRPGSGRPPAPQADRLAGGAGAVWVASKCGPRPSRYGFLSRIDPRTNRVTRAVALRRSSRDQRRAGGRMGRHGHRGPAHAAAARTRAASDRSAHRSVGLGDAAARGRHRRPRRRPRAVWAARSGTSRAGTPAGAVHRVGAARARLSRRGPARRPPASPSTAAACGSSTPTRRRCGELGRVDGGSAPRLEELQRRLAASPAPGDVLRVQEDLVGAPPRAAAGASAACARRCRGCPPSTIDRAPAAAHAQRDVRRLGDRQLEHRGLAAAGAPRDELHDRRAGVRYCVQRSPAAQ